MDKLELRLLVYNIRYGSGSGRYKHLPVPGSGFLKAKYVDEIAAFIKLQQPDLVALTEVDTGSVRSRGLNQAQAIADQLGHFSVFQNKYVENSIASSLPILNHQGNAFLVSEELHHPKFHYFKRGVKRLIIELETDEIVYFLVHLSLWYRHRQEQLWELCQLIDKIDKPVIIAGDFNTFWGSQELNLFNRATGLISANLGNRPTFPSHKPNLELDFVLHDSRIQPLNLNIPSVRYSDHLPLVFDYSLELA